MSNKMNRRSAQRHRRHQRIRKKIHGTADRPRLVVFRSLKNMEGQLVDDDGHRTLMGLSTVSKDVQGLDPDEGGKIGLAKAAGKLLGERAVKSGIETVVFDRGGYLYHGRVQAFAEGAREGGLKF